MIRSLHNLHDETAQILNRHGHEPLFGSQAHNELNSFQRAEPVKYAYIQANLLIEGVADHLIAYTRTVTEPVGTISPWTCVRAALESAALASWLLTPRIDARERAQRSFAFRYEGLIQQRKFAQASNMQPVVVTIDNRIGKVERDAIQLGYSQVLDRRGRRSGIAQQMPPVTEIIRDTFGEEAIYRLMSAVAHAHTWATHQIGFRRAGSEEEILLEKNIEPVTVAFLCVKAANIFAQPIWYKCQLFGWNCDEFRSIFTSTFASLGSQWVEPQ
jgi:hypothetical protein